VTVLRTTPTIATRFMQFPARGPNSAKAPHERGRNDKIEREADAQSGHFSETLRDR